MPAESRIPPESQNQSKPRLFDIQVGLTHVISFLALVLFHEAGVVWWGATITGQINQIEAKMIDGDDVRSILDRDAPWLHVQQSVRSEIQRNTNNNQLLEARVRELEKLAIEINTKLQTIITRLPNKQTQRGHKDAEEES